MAGRAAQTHQGRADYALWSGARVQDQPRTVVPEVAADRNRNSMIELGSIVKDSVTGFQGLAVSRYDHLFGVPEIKILPQRLEDNGKPAEAIWFEESRVVEVRVNVETAKNLT